MENSETWDCTKISPHNILLVVKCWEMTFVLVLITIRDPSLAEIIPLFLNMTFVLGNDLSCWNPQRENKSMDTLTQSMISEYGTCIKVCDFNEKKN